MAKRINIRGTVMILKQAKKVIANAAEDQAAEEKAVAEALESILLQEQVEGWGPTTLAFYGKNRRAILISGEISQEVANCVVSQIFELSDEDDAAPIMIYINTEGGSVIDGLAIYDAMRITTCPIVTMVTGACHSAGIFILQGGDHRLATPHSSFFHHEIMSSYEVFNEHASDSHAARYRSLNAATNDIILKRSKMQKSVWNKYFAGKTAYFFDAKTALEHKLIDEIVDYAKPKPVKVNFSVTGK